MTIAEHRKHIDLLDAKIIRLLNERTLHALEIGAMKLKAGQEIYAPHRELLVLERVCRLNRGPLTQESLRAIYREIMSGALVLQKTMTLAYFGPPATFTHLAAIRRFGTSLHYAPQKTRRSRRSSGRPRHSRSWGRSGPRTTPRWRAGWTMRWPSSKPRPSMTTSSSTTTWCRRWIRWPRFSTRTVAGSTGCRTPVRSPARIRGELAALVAKVR